MELKIGANLAVQYVISKYDIIVHRLPRC